MEEQNEDENCCCGTRSIDFRLGCLRGQCKYILDDTNGASNDRFIRHSGACCV